MAIQDQTTARRTVVVDTFTDGLLGPDVAMAGPVADGGHIVWNSTPGLLGPDDHARDPRRARGLHARLRRGRRGRRRDRDPHQGHRGHLAGHLVGQRPGDGGPLQRRSVLRGRLSGLRRRVAGDPRRRHRRDRDPLRRLRRRRDPVHVHQRLHGRVRRPARDHRRRGPRAGLRPRRPGRRRAARQLRPEPDPHLRPARHRRPRHAHAARSSASSARRPRRRCPTRTTPATSARSSSARRTSSRSTARRCSSTRPTGTWTSTPCAPARRSICPVKVPGGGVYLGDMHAMQGDGEIAGHTADVAGTVTLQVEVIKGLGIDGPVLFPLAEDLPFLAKPLTAAERARAEALAAREGVGAIEESLPISVIGTGPDLNSATDNGLRSRRRVAGHERARGHEPRDDRRCDRDRPRPGRRAGHVPRAGRRARGAGFAATQRSCMPERDGFAPGTPSWVDLATPDVDAAEDFYGELFGWTTLAPGTIEETGGYRFFLSRRAQGRGRQPADDRGPARRVVDLLRHRRRRRARRARARLRRHVVLRPDGRHGRGPDGLLRARGGRRVRGLAGGNPHGRRAGQRAGLAGLEHADHARTRRTPRRSSG